MTETLTGKQVLALLAQDDVPEIEYKHIAGTIWSRFDSTESWSVPTLLWQNTYEFRIKPKPARRLSVTLANGEVVSWPEPVREALKDGQEFWTTEASGKVIYLNWNGCDYNQARLAFGNAHLTREAAQEHADALRKINTQGAAC